MKLTAARAQEILKAGPSIYDDAAIEEAGAIGALAINYAICSERYLKEGLGRRATNEAAYQLHKASWQEARKALAAALLQEEPPK